MRRFQNVLIDDEAGRLSRSISARPIGRVLLQVHIRCWMSERYGNALDSSSAPVISHLAKMKENKKPCGFSGGLLVAREGTRLLHPGGIKVFRLGGGGRGEGGRRKNKVWFHSIENVSQDLSPQTVRHQKQQFVIMMIIATTMVQGQ